MQAIHRGLDLARPEGVEGFVRQFLFSFPDLPHRVEAMIARHDHLAVRSSVRGTHTGEGLHFSLTGKVIQCTGATMARIAEDKIVEHRAL